jgi:hypothetical protein
MGPIWFCNHMSVIMKVMFWHSDNYCSFYKFSFLILHLFPWSPQILWKIQEIKGHNTLQLEWCIMFCAYIGMCPLYCIYKKQDPCDLDSISFETICVHDCIYIFWFIAWMCTTYGHGCVFILPMNVFHVAHDYVHECVVYLYVLVWIHLKLEQLMCWVTKYLSLKFMCLFCLCIFPHQNVIQLKV